MFGRAAISADRSCGISVPTAAIHYRSGGTSVQVVNGATVQTLSVQVGLHSDTDTEIREGLRDGDVVVANAGASLRRATRSPRSSPTARGWTPGNRGSRIGLTHRRCAKTPHFSAIKRWLRPLG